MLWNKLPYRWPVRASSTRFSGCASWCMSDLLQMRRRRSFPSTIQIPSTYHYSHTPSELAGFVWRRPGKRYRVGTQKKRGAKKQQVQPGRPLTEKRCRCSWGFPGDIELFNSRDRDLCSNTQIPKYKTSDSIIMSNALALVVFLILIIFALIRISSYQKLHYQVLILLNNT